MVEDLFAWIKANRNSIPSKSEIENVFFYCINQEKCLKAFLYDPIIPMDNNAAEIGIRSFCVGRNNWHIIDTPQGAEASAIIYSLAESAKSTNLKPYNYFKYILEELQRHQDDTNLDFLDSLLP